MNHELCIEKDNLICNLYKKMHSILLIDLLCVDIHL